VRVIVPAAGIVIGFLLMTSPAQADTGGLSATLRKTTHAAGLGTVARHTTKTVRQAAKVTHALPVTHKISRPAAVHRVVARTSAMSVQRFSRPAAHRVAVTTAAAHRIASVESHSRHVVDNAAAGMTKATGSKSKITAGTNKITAAPGRSATGIAKITAPASETAAFVTGSRDIGTIVTPGLLRPVADAGAILSDAIQPAAQSVLAPTSRLDDRLLAVLQDKIAQSIPPMVSNQAGSGLGIQPSTPAGQVRAASGSAAAWANPPSGQPNGMTTTSTSSGGLTAVLSDLASGVSQALLGARASTGGAAAAVALLTIAVGVAAAGNASPGGPAGISFAFVEGGLLTSATSRAQQLGGSLRQTGWRTPHRPTFSPD
jgi:hypothetical protein